MLNDNKSSEIDCCKWVNIQNGAQSWPLVGLDKRVHLLREIRNLLHRNSREWIEICSQAKSLTTQAQRSEEILAGPVGVSRYLTILSSNLEKLVNKEAISSDRSITSLSSGKLQVNVFPVSQVMDQLLFPGLKAAVWIKPDISRDQIHGDLLEPILDPPNPAPVSVVLGAGNVSAIPLTDALAKLFQESHVVLLKLNPVNEYLKDVFEKILAPVITPGWMKIVTGDAAVGKELIESPLTNSIHITGSQQSHDAIVWGSDLSQASERKANGTPLLEKPITSELGNVSPWIIVPGKYSSRELRMQAMNIAASLTNNAGFNCVTTRVIVTSRSWPQRSQFLTELRQSLKQIPARVPYYPGSAERYQSFLNGPAPIAEDGTLEWRLLEDYPLDNESRLFSEESFLPVSIEVALNSETAERFLHSAVEFCNEGLYGTLSVAITCTNRFRKEHRKLLFEQVDHLNYGSVCINQWPGLVYGLMTPPWGGAPDTNLNDVQSGQGCVHNLFFLDNYEKTLFSGPLCNFPKPVWFANHSRSEDVAWKLLDYYCGPSVLKLPGLIATALLG
ncbi:aldehyde dehydrogenase family protein [Rubinisphaera italica]|uniref:Aldehyde dehydrogenase family protein n=1 Tax=Rubinisphaera italica TaxID=2527969 RepID=A0A5C5XG04_9PLAN|nr:aldehyde dehydrogenase family protein [Rubinisphaera italica]TWT61321.1 Aldehyde dehydrogenase family protein [Rubinisphaera italica]